MTRPPPLFRAAADGGPSPALPGGRFDFIMADPPWRFQTRSGKGVTAKGAGGQYRTMSLADIMAMPVSEIAAPDCLLWLWATNPMLPQAFEVLTAWGFQFKTAGHWMKTTRHGRMAFGTGYILRCAGEPFLIGTRGRPVTTRAVRSVIVGPVREHSRKPEQAFRAAEQLMPEARRVELFSRENRPGWSVWGDETGKFQNDEGLFDDDLRRTAPDGAGEPAACAGGPDAVGKPPAPGAAAADL